MVQAIVINQPGGEGYLTYHDPYGNAYTTEKITFGAFSANAATCSSIATALQRLPNNALNSIEVSMAGNFYAFTRTDPKDTTGAGTLKKVFMNTAGNAEPSGTVANPARGFTICFVEFQSEPGSTGYQNLLGCHISAHNTVGQHPVAAGVAGSCTVYEVYPDLAVAWPPSSTLLADGVTPNNQVADGTAATRPLTELSECSGRGTCDYSAGTCSCFAGHMGLACQKQEALV